LYTVAEHVLTTCCGFQCRCGSGWLSGDWRTMDSLTVAKGNLADEFLVHEIKQEIKEEVT